MNRRALVTLSAVLVGLSSAWTTASAGPPAPQGAELRKCYRPAPKISRLKVRESFIASSKTIDHIGRGQVFWGEAVVYEGRFENKVLVFVEGKDSWVGIVRRTETVVVDIDWCKAPALYQGEGLTDGVPERAK
jgi:hypothetical protein